MKPYRAVCFDFDYTLGDSTDSIVAGFQYGLTRMGWPKPDREAVRATIGYLLEDSYTMLTGDNDPARRAQFRPLFLEVAQERQRLETTLFPGAVELLRRLRAHGVKTAIVSTKRGDTIGHIMERHGVLDCLEFIIGSEHVKRPKPDPQGLLLAMGRMGAGPEEEARVQGQSFGDGLYAFFSFCIRFVAPAGMAMILIGQLASFLA